MVKFYTSKFKELRKLKKVSIEKILSDLNITRVTLWRWEVEKIFPNEAQVRLLAKSLDVPVSQISDLTDEVKLSGGDYSEIVNSWLVLANANEQQLIAKEDKILNLIKQRHYELRQASIIIRALLSSLESIFYFKDVYLQYITANKAFLDNLSLASTYSVLGKEDSDFFTPAESKKNTEQDNHVLITGKAIHNVEQFIPGTKKKKWGLISKLPVFDSLGKIAGVIGSFVDITDRVYAEQQRQLLEKVINYSDDIFWIAKQDDVRYSFKYLFISHAAKKLYDIGDEELEHFEGVEKKYKDAEKENMDLIKTRNFPCEKTAEIVKPDGTKRIVNRRIFKLQDKNLFYGVTKDITNEIKTQETDELLKESIEGMNDGYAIRNLDTNQYIYINSACGKIFGHPREYFYKGGGDVWLEKVVHPEDRPRLKKYVENQKWPCKIQYRIVKPDGEVRYIQSSLATKHYHGHPCLIGVTTDITNDKRIGELYELLEKHMTTTGSGIIICDHDRMRYCSKIVADIYGYPLEEILKSPCIDSFICMTVHPDDRELHERQVHNFLNYSYCEYRIITKKGEIKWVSTHSTSQTFLGIKCNLTICKDITENKKIEEEKELLHNVLSITDDAIIIYDIEQNKYVYLNKAIEKITGYSLEDFYNSKEDFFNNCVNPADAKIREKRLKEKKWPTNTRYNIIHKDGSIRICDCTINQTKVMRRQCVIAVLRDITEQEKDIRKLLEMTMNNISQSFTIRDLNSGELLFINKATENIFGYPVEEFKKNGVIAWINQFVYKEDRDRMLNFIETRNFPEYYEYRFSRPDTPEQLRWVRTVFYHLTYNERECIASADRDITYMNKGREVRNLMDLHFESTGSAFIIHDKNKVVYADKTIERIYGYPFEKVTEGYFNFRLNKCIHKDDRETEQKYIELYKWPEKRRFRIITPDKQIKYIEGSSSTAIMHNGIKCMSLIETDITEKVKYENEILRLKQELSDLKSK